MDDTITKLMDARHKAFAKALEGGFKVGADVMAFREVNRAYVAARLGIDSQAHVSQVKRKLSAAHLAKMQAAKGKAI